MAARSNLQQHATALLGRGRTRGALNLALSLLFPRSGAWRRFGPVHKRGVAADRTTDPSASRTRRPQRQASASTNASGRRAAGPSPRRASRGSERADICARVSREYRSVSRGLSTNLRLVSTERRISQGQVATCPYPGYGVAGNPTSIGFIPLAPNPMKAQNQLRVLARRRRAEI